MAKIKHSNYNKHNYYGFSPLYPPRGILASLMSECDDGQEKVNKRAKKKLGWQKKAKWRAKKRRAWQAGQKGKMAQKK